MKPLRVVRLSPVVLSGVLLSLSLSSFAEMDFELHTELATGLSADADKSEMILELEWRETVSESVDLFSSIQVLLDPAQDLRSSRPNNDNYSKVNGPLLESESGALTVRELYADFYAAGVRWRVGKQQVVWGESDGLKVLDVINPQDFREFNLPEFEDSRIPTWMLNAEVEVADGSLQLLVIPDTTYAKLPEVGSTFEFSSNKIVPAAGGIPITINRESSERPAGALETGLRYRLFHKGWDITFNYFHHYLDTPALYRDIEGGELFLRPIYRRSHLFGVSASNAFGDWVVRSELGYSSKTFQLRDDLNERGIAETPELSSVIGLDYQGFSDWLLSYQLFTSRLTDDEKAIVRNTTRMQQTFLVRYNMLNDNLVLDMFAIYSNEDDDGQLRVSAEYQVDDDLQIRAGVDSFFGNDRGLFGQYDRNDRVVLGFSYAF